MQLQESPQATVGRDELPHWARHAREPHSSLAPSQTLLPLVQLSSQRPPAQPNVTPLHAWLPSQLTWQSYSSVQFSCEFSQVLLPLQFTRQANPAGQSKLLFAQLLPQLITQTPLLQLLQTLGQAPPGGATPVLHSPIPAEPPAPPLLPPLPEEPPWPPPLTPPSPALAPTPPVPPAPDALPLPPTPPASLPPMLALPPSPPAPTWASGGVSGNKLQPSAMTLAAIQPGLEPRNACSVTRGAPTNQRKFLNLRSFRSGCGERRTGGVDGAPRGHRGRRVALHTLPKPVSNSDASY